MKVYGNTASRALRVFWLLEELGLPYDRIAAGPQSPEVRAVNPSGKVPVLVDGDFVLTDSTAIMTFLAEREGRFTHPAGTPDRARQDSLTHFLLDEMDASLWTAARHSFILPTEHRLPAIKDSLKWEFARAETRLADRLQGPFLMGEAMSIADILAAHCLLWARTAKFPLSNPALADYLTRMTARPAFTRATA